MKMEVQRDASISLGMPKIEGKLPEARRRQEKTPYSFSEESLISDF